MSSGSTDKLVLGKGIGLAFLYIARLETHFVELVDLFKCKGVQILGLNET